MPPDSVTPRAPDPPLVDPETGETPPLSPIPLKPVRWPEWTDYEGALWRTVHDVTEPDDAA